MTREGGSAIEGPASMDTQRSGLHAITLEALRRHAEVLLTSVCTVGVVPAIVREAIVRFQ
jgi:hypothetical protein